PGARSRAITPTNFPNHAPAFSRRALFFRFFGVLFMVFFTGIFTGFFSALFIVFFSASLIRVLSCVLRGTAAPWRFPRAIPSSHPFLRQSLHSTALATL